MFTLCLLIYFQGAERKELLKRITIPFAPAPGTHFEIASTKRGETMTIGSRSPTLTYDVEKREFRLQESWNSAWIQEFEALGFVEEKRD